MNNLRGAVEVEVNGVKRYAKFGTYQSSLFCELRGLTLPQMQQLLSEENIRSGNIPLLVWIDFYYAAFKTGAIAANQPQDFDAFDVSCWFDEDPALMDKLNLAAEGANGPNGGNRQTRRAMGKAK